MSFSLRNTNSHSWGIPYSGNNPGVGGRDNINFPTHNTPSSPRWKTMLGPNAGNPESNGEGKRVSYGTSAGNPLILKGGQSITFQCSFLVNQDINNIGVAAITTTVAQALCGRPLTWGAGQAFTAIDTNVTPEIEIDLDISQGMKIHEDNPYAKLVCGVVEAEDFSGGFMVNEEYENRYKAPIGHFIVNKAKVKFYFEKDESFGMIDNDYEMIRLGIAEIRDVETVTVAKKKFPESPWFCFTKEWFESGNMNLNSGSLQMGFNGVEGYQSQTQLGSAGETVTSTIMEAENGTLDDWNYDYHLPETTQQYCVEIEEEDSDINSLYDQPEISVNGHYASVMPAQVAGLEEVWMPARQNNTLASGGSAGFYGPTTDTEYTPLKENLEQKQEMWFLGYLDFNEYNVGQYRFNEFFNFNKDYFQDSLGDYEVFPFSLLDGEAGPGGDLAHNLHNGWQHIPNIGSNHRLIKTFTWWYYNNANNDPGAIVDPDHYDAAWVMRVINLGGPEFTGSINTRMIPTRDSHILMSMLPSISSWQSGPASGFNPQNPAYSSYGAPYGRTNAKGPNRTYLYYMQGSPVEGTDQPNTELTDNGSVTLYPYSHYHGQEPGQENSWALGDGFPFIIDFNTKAPHLEIIAASTVFDQQSGQGGGGGDRTFKSSANHDFGIVYYDQRGRHGFVNHLKTVYVPGYSHVERGINSQGKSIITLNLEHDPPEWAHHYKIVYTKNTTVQNFVQYTTGGAWPVKEGPGMIENTKIYVSLNYLQHSSLSYVKDWGARNPEGGLNMFKFIPGANQKCKIISAYTDADNREFPYNYEFDITDVVILTEENNPLTDTPEEEPWTMGEFAVLRNNKAAIGFGYAAVADGSHRWNNNCVVELFTPQKGIEADERFYYEIGDTYSIDNPGTSQRQHSQTSIVLSKGDVWWRKVPVNWKPYEGGDFQNLIQWNDNDTYINTDDYWGYASNFVPYYLETETANDLFKADASFIGRPNIIMEDAVESIRESSITYSGQSNPNSRKVNYSSFNYTLSNFKELQEEFGDINYMCNIEGDVFVIQSDRCTLVPASKTLFSDISGTDTIAASVSPLGQERVYAGRAGCDNNPESAVQVGAYVYFAHKNLGKIFRFNPANGVQEISNQGMASYFRELFRDALQSSMDPNYNDIRVVGGYDPVNDEYLLTVLDPLTYGISTTYDPGVDSGYDEPLNPGVTTTIDNLEQQIWDILDGIINTEDDEGKPVFDKEELPDRLKAFYDNPPTPGVLDYKLHLDADGDGIFKADEVVSSSVIKSVFDDSVSRYAQQVFDAFESDYLQPLFDAIDDPGVSSDIVSVVNHINSLESMTAELTEEGEVLESDFLSHISNVVNPLTNLLVSLSNNRQNYLQFTSDNIGEVSSASTNIETFMGAFGPEGTYPLDDTINNLVDVSNLLRSIQFQLGGEQGFGLQAVDGTQVYSNDGLFSGNVIDNLQDDVIIGGDFFVNFKSTLSNIMNASISSNTDNNILGVAQEFIANNYLEALRNNSIATMTVDDVQNGLVPQSIVDYLNEQFGLNLTVGVLQTNYPELVTQIEGNLIISLGADPNLLTGYTGGQGLIDSIVNNYLLDNPSLSQGLQSFMTNNNIATQGDLLTAINGWQESDTTLQNMINQYVPDGFTNEYGTFYAPGAVALQTYISSLQINGYQLNFLINEYVPDGFMGATGHIALAFYIDSLINNQGGGDGQYNSLDEALAAEGINLMQLKDLTQQILALQTDGPSLSQYYADANNDQTISTGDLLVFLGVFGATFTVNTNQNYTGLNLN